LMWVRAAI